MVQKSQTASEAGLLIYLSQNSDEVALLLLLQGKEGRERGRLFTFPGDLF